MMCSKLLKPASQDTWLMRQVDKGMNALAGFYSRSLTGAMKHPLLVSLLVVAALGASATWLN